MNTILRAAQFARQAHAGQRRKYNGRSYVEHPGRVAARVCVHELASEHLVAAAWLHDVIEDTGTDAQRLRAEFGEKVARLVAELTNPSKGSTASRTERKALDLQHLAAVSREAKVIKLIDRIDNLREMAGAPYDFVRTYVEESVLLAAVLGDADPQLEAELLELAEQLAASVQKSDPEGNDKQVMRVAFDVDETITAHPGFFACISEALVAADHRVYIISFREDRTGTVELLAGYGIRYHEMILADPDEIEQVGFNQWKASVCRQLHIDVFFEDMPEVINELDDRTLAVMPVDRWLGRVTYERDETE